MLISNIKIFFSMEVNEDKPALNKREIDKFLSITTPKNARLTLMKLYFSRDKEVINEEDEEEVYFMYNLLEKLQT